MIERCIILAFIFQTVSYTPALAQSTCTITGTVFDTSGAVVPRAKVTIQNVETGLVRVTESNESGAYTHFSLPPGRYRVIVEAVGFASSIKDDIKLDVGSVTKLDVELKPAGTVEQVTVTGESAPLVETTRVEVSGVIDQRQMENLPVDGRSFASLATLIPGATLQGSFDPTKARVGTFSVGGSTGRNLNITVDGADNSDSQTGGEVIGFTRESISEFRVEMGLLSANVGRAGNSAVTAVTRGGTNTFHGSGFISFRDDKLQAKGPFGGSVKPSFDRERFGGSVGGPIKRDKAFFFITAERDHNNEVTTAGQRDESSKLIIQRFAPIPSRVTFISTRGDFNLTDKDQIALRYSLQDSSRSDPGASQDGKLQDPNNFIRLDNISHQIFANWTRTVSSNSLNILRFNILASKFRSSPFTTDAQIVFPSINVGANFLGDRSGKQQRYQIKDELFLNLGSHRMEFGVDYSHISLPESQNFNLFGTGIAFAPCDFAGEPGCPQAGQDSDIPLMLSIINLETLLEGFNGFGAHGLIPAISNDTLDLYFQDNYRAGQNFSLNFGLRWNYDHDIIGKNQVNQFRPGKRRSRKKNIGPNISGVWELGRIVIRGGYGLHFAENFLETRQMELLADGSRLPIGRAFSGTLANPFEEIGRNTPPDIFVTNNDLREPYFHNFILSTQINILADWEVSTNLIIKRGRRFPRRVEVNRQTDGSRIDLDFGSVIETQSIANTAFDGLTTQIAKRYSDHFMFNASYTLSRSVDEDNDALGFINTVSDPANHELDRGPEAFESRHRFEFSGLFDMGWGMQLSSIITAFSSRPFEIVQNHDFSEGIKSGSFRLPGLGRNAGNRQIRNGADLNEVIESFNANAALVAAHGGPIALVDPSIDLSHPYFSLDLRVTKTFRFSEGMSLEVGIEAFNLFNHINVSGISSTNSSGLQNNVESPNFGQPLGVTNGGMFGSSSPRAFQLLAKFRF